MNIECNNVIKIRKYNTVKYLQLVLIIVPFLFIQATCQSSTAEVSPEVKEAMPTKTAIAKNDGVIKLEDYVKEQSLDQYPVALLAGGCFWCTEAVFERVNGVVDVVSGYAGGGTKNVPSYKAIGTGTTGFAEAIAVFYDPEVITYETILEVFFIGHDPTTLNYQGPDHGTQYRSSIFYQSDDELAMAKAGIAKTDKSGKYPDPVVTTLEAYDQFWTAETYHQDFYEHNPNQGYVRAVSKPKVDKVLKLVPELIKKEYLK